MDDLRTPLANTFTLGVEDLPREREFYHGLGRHTVFDGDDFVVFELRGALLALFPLDKPARDAQASPGPGRGGIRSSVIISVGAPGDVDRVIEAARRAGGMIAKEPGDGIFFDGRDAYFADPEGNYWEVAWAAHDNPVSAAARRAAGLAH